jgi:hypothetical protein
VSRTIYGCEIAKSPTQELNFTYDVIGKNAEVFTFGDPVTVDASHGLDVAAATSAIYGIVQKTATMAADNETVAKVKPAVIPIDQDYEFLMGTNADLTPLTSPSAYYKLAGTTGAVQVDVTSGAQTGNARVVVCTKVDPNNEGGSGAGSGLRQGLFIFVKVFNIKSDVTSA